MAKEKREIKVPSSYVLIVAIISTVIALSHFSRLYYGWGAQIGGWMVPMWPSFLGLLVFGALSIFSIYLFLSRGK